MVDMMRVVMDGDRGDALEQDTLRREERLMRFCACLPNPRSVSPSRSVLRIYY
jgi:hypothetical protein